MKRKLLLAILMIAGAFGMNLNAQTWTGNAPAAGTFYLYNVEAGKFLNNGDPAESWGTNAYLQAGFGLDILFEATNTENVYNLNTNVSNGGNYYYLAATTWCDGAATAWEFRAVEGQTNVYQIVTNGQYLMATEALNDVVMAGDPGSRVTATYWKLVSEDDFKAAMQAKTFSATNPMDVSVFIKGRSFSRNDGRNNMWVRTYQNANNQKFVEGYNNKYYGNEFWNQTFDIHQDITGLPDGTYEVQCSGFGTNGTTFVYGNNQEGALTSENSAANGSRQTAYQLIADQDAWSGQTSGTFTLSGGNLTVGLKRTQNVNYDWCVYDEFRLYYYGLDLSEFAATLAATVAKAEAVEGTVPTAAYNALAAVVAQQNKTYTTAAEYSAAANAIEDAITAAKALQPNYAHYLAIRAEVLALDDDATIFTGTATVDVTDADAAVATATTNADINAAIAVLRADAATFLGSVTVNEGKFFTITSVFLENADFSAGNIDGWETNYVSGQQANNIGYQGSSYSNTVGEETITISKFIEAWKPGAALGDGYLRQTVLGLPEGKYTLEADGISTWQNDDSREITGALLYINAAGVDYTTAMSTRNGKPLHFMAQFLSPGNVDVTFGLKTVSATCNWLCADNFTVKFYGIDLSPYATLLAEAVAEAEALNGTIPVAAYSDLTSVVTANNKSYSTSAQYTTAIANIQAATATARTMQAPYSRYQQIRTAVLAINSNIDVSTADADLNDATSVADIEDAIVTLREALTDYLATAPASSLPVDVSAALIDNASPGTAGNDEFWTASAAVGRGNNLIEYYQKSGATYTQQLGVNAPKGNYTLTVVGYTRTGYDAVITANEFTAPLPQVASSEVNNLAGGNTWIAAGNGVASLTFQLTSAQALTIGIKAATTGDNWTAWRSFKLEYLGEEFPAYTLVTGKMNADVAAAQTSAEATFLADKTMANYTALMAAIAAAESSKAAYEAAAAELAEARAIRENHNFATAEATTTFDGVISTWTAAYDNGTMSNAEANSLGATLGTVVTGWHEGANGAAVKYVESGFGLNAFDEALYINTWSVEGETDGSDFKVPFFEYWIGDEQTLAAHDWTGTLSGLENGLYKVSAIVRARATNNVAATDATGITLAVNDGTAVDVTEGTQIGESQFNLGTYEAEGLVKNGKLNVTFSVADGNNISWLSFQNVKYTKVRDLTPEEAASSTGDVNGDGSVTIADVTALVNIILGKGTETPAADVNGDGSVTIADVTALVNVILGKN